MIEHEIGIGEIWLRLVPKRAAAWRLQVLVRHGGRRRVVIDEGFDPLAPGVVSHFVSAHGIDARFAPAKRPPASETSAARARRTSTGAKRRRRPE